MRCLSRRTKTSIQLAVVESMVWVPTWWNLIVRWLERYRRRIGQLAVRWLMLFLVGRILHVMWWPSKFRDGCLLTYRKLVSVAQISWDIHRFGKYLSQVLALWCCPTQICPNLFIPENQICGSGDLQVSHGYTHFDQQATQSDSVATVMTDVFRKNWITMSLKLLKPWEYLWR